jgi:hypothetical protein
MQRDTGRRQLTFGWATTMRWEELPLPLRDEIRLALSRVLCAVAQDADDPREEDADV